MEIYISKYLHDKCNNFANNRIQGSANLYAYRGETRKAKMIEDIVIGTLGEYAVWKFLKEKGTCSKPDLKIYENSRKSFSADLSSEWGMIHVKSQSLKSANSYGASWLFQKEDKLFKGKKDNDYIAFCIVDGKKVEIKAIVKVKEVKNLLKEPKVWRYKHTKKALYLEDVLKGVKDLWQIK